MKRIGLAIAALLLLLFVDVTEVAAQKKIVPYPSIREADMMWKKRVWREVDFRQKMNLPFYYPIESHDGERNFISVIMDALAAGDIQAYKVKTNGELNEEIPYSKLKKSLDAPKRFKKEQEDGSIVYIDTVIAFKPQTVERLHIMEDWYFDSKRSQLLVRIQAISPVQMVEINIGGRDTLVPNEMFWVKFNDSTRMVLSEAPFFNRNNSAARLSYDDVFWKRMFDSYIYKEENVYDRRIGDYATGIDALYESERIKQEIINYEQNVWEY